MKYRLLLIKFFSHPYRVMSRDAGIDRTGATRLAVCIISYGEIDEGAYYARLPDEALAGLDAFLKGRELIPLTVPIMEQFGIVRGQLGWQVRNQVGDMDLLIAATALTYDLTLPTRIVRDFQLIESPKVF